MKADVTAENKPACSRCGVNTNVEAYGQNAHEYQRGIQIFIVFLDKVVIVIVRRTLELIVELDSGIVGGPEAWKESWECLEHGLLHAEDGGRKGDENGSNTGEDRLVWRTLLGQWSLPPLPATRTVSPCPTS